MASQLGRAAVICILVLPHDVVERSQKVHAHLVLRFRQMALQPSLCKILRHCLILLALRPASIAPASTRRFSISSVLQAAWMPRQAAQASQAGVAFSVWAKVQR